MNVSPEAWAVIGTSVATFGGVLVAIITTRRNASKTQAAVEEVRTLAEPTGNGFAARVTEALNRIERRQEQDAVAARKAAELLAEHLSDHARAQINRPDRD